MASQPYLFYSERCANSKQIIETLKALNKAGLYKFVLVESLPRDKIPSFLTKVPTLYIPDTKEVVVGKNEIFGFIAKPTNARKELPTKEAVATGGASQTIGDISAWGFEGSSALTETYSSWDNPNSFVGAGGSMYTFLDQNVSMAGGAPEPKSENTVKNKSGTNDDVSARLAVMEEQRKKEFGEISRK